MPVSIISNCLNLKNNQKKNPLLKPENPLVLVDKGHILNRQFLKAKKQIPIFHYGGHQLMLTPA